MADKEMTDIVLRLESKETGDIYDINLKLPAGSVKQIKEGSRWLPEKLIIEKDMLFQLTVDTIAFKI